MLLLVLLLSTVTTFGQTINQVLNPSPPYVEELNRKLKADERRRLEMREIRLIEEEKRNKPKREAPPEYIYSLRKLSPKLLENDGKELREKIDLELGQLGKRRESSQVFRDSKKIPDEKLPLYFIDNRSIIIDVSHVGFSQKNMILLEKISRLVDGGSIHLDGAFARYYLDEIGIGDNEVFNLVSLKNNLQLVVKFKEIREIILSWTSMKQVSEIGLVVPAHIESQLGDDLWIANQGKKLFPKKLDTEIQKKEVPLTLFSIVEIKKFEKCVENEIVFGCSGLSNPSGNCFEGEGTKMLTVCNQAKEYRTPIQDWELTSIELESVAYPSWQKVWGPERKYSFRRHYLVKNKEVFALDGIDDSQPGKATMRIEWAGQILSEGQMSFIIKSEVTGARSFLYQKEMGTKETVWRSHRLPFIPSH